MSFENIACFYFTSLEKRKNNDIFIYMNFRKVMYESAISENL